MDSKQNIIEIAGSVVESLPNLMFRVELEDGRLVLCTVAGKMRLHHIRVMPGDRVTVAMTPYDQAKGRIIYRVG